jgi:ElaB/YqjD/DUF883 family membrane-anchored ribosome-binding protein
MERKTTTSSDAPPNEDPAVAPTASPKETSGHGKEFRAAAAGAMDLGASHLHALQDNFSALKDSASNFAAQTGADVARSATDIASDVKDRVGDMADGLVEKGVGAASQAAAKAKSLGDHVESIVRGNPLGSILGAVVIGALLGMRGRGRRS